MTGRYQQLLLMNQALRQLRQELALAQEQLQVHRVLSLMILIWDLLITTWEEMEVVMKCCQLQESSWVGSL